MTQTLGAHAARGAVVTLGAQLTRMLIQVGSVVVLSRLLTPHDYGVLAMVVAIIGVGELLRDFGLSSAAVQARTLSTQQRDNLFWINSGIGLTLGLVCAACAPLLAAFYDEPDLVAITRALAVTFLLNGMSTQYRAGLMRTMRFRSLALVDVAAPLVALVVAIVVALGGGGTWALVAQQIATAGTGLFLLVGLSRWFPRLPRRGVPMRGFIRFGGSLLVSQLIGYLANNVDSVIIGRRFGSVELGYYNRAFQLLMTPLGQIRAPSTSVALPALSRVQDDHRRFNEYVKAGQLALAMPVTVVLAVLIGAATPAVDVFLGDEWSSVAPILQLLAVAGLFQTLAFVGYWVYLARALTRSLMNYSIVSALIRITCIVVGSQWGVVGVAAGYAVAPLIAWPISLWWLGRVTTIPSRALYAGAGRLIGLGIPVAVTSLFVVDALVGTSSWVQLTVGAVAGLAVALGVALAVPALRRDLKQIVFIGRLALSRKAAS